MTMIGRVYETEDRASAAVQRLKHSGFPEDSVFLVPSGTPAEAMPGDVPGCQAVIYSRMLAKDSASLVLVRAEFGWGERITRVLNDCGPIYTKDLPVIDRRNPAPFSSFFGMPTLSTRGLSYLSKLFPELTRPDFHFSGLFGMKLLLKSKANWRKSFGLKLLSDRKKNWQKSFGLPLLKGSR